MFRILCMLLLTGMAWMTTPVRAQASAVADGMAERTRSCTHCHGKQGRAGPDGYYPRLAGKPATYLYAQLQHFREGRRHYAPMSELLAPLSDAYLMDMAEHFARQDVPYPAAPSATAPAPVLERGRQLVTRGDPARQLPACTQCHGERLTGVLPAVPGLLGLPRHYLNAQLGGWQTGQRAAHAPDCMAAIAKRLGAADVNAVSLWLATQPVPTDSRPQAAAPLPISHPATLCGNAAPPPAEPVASAMTSSAARGAYLARAGNCMGCHTATGGTPFAGGRGIQTPFGTVFAGNLTPDPLTGLGGWSADDFWQAMHKGRSRDGRLLSPAFPYTRFTGMRRDDADDLFAYLKTLAPVVRPQTPHTLRWPTGTQAALAVWRALYFKPADHRPDPVMSASWNRGAYLVTTLGHCGECHTPRNLLGASREGEALRGGRMPMQSWYAPSLRSGQEAGVGDWSIDEVSSWLKTGMTTRATATGPMAEVVSQSTQHLTDDDRQAMATYLIALGNRQTATPVTKTMPGREASDASAAGARLYNTHCASCHGDQGQGVAGAYPALAGNRALTQSDTTNLVKTIRAGGFAPATAAHPRPYGMPPFRLQLSDRDTAAVLTYLRGAWGQRAAPVSEFEVSRVRETP
jgi:cytochrome c553